MVASEPMPLLLAVEHDGPGFMLLLSDGRSVSRLARLDGAFAVLQSLSDDAQAGDTAAAQVLWSWLFPPAISAVLCQSPTRPLALQLPAMLDALAWELAEHEGRALGGAFAVSRHLPTLDDPAASSMTTRMTGGSLRLLVVDEASATLDATFCRRLMQCRFMSAQQWSQQDRLVALAEHDVVLIAPASALALPELLVHATGQLPALLVLPGSNRQVVQAIVHRLGPRGTATLAAPMAPWTSLEPLIDQLRAGLPIDEAVRRLRADPTAATSCRGLVLYGPASTPIVDAATSAAAPAGLRQVTTLSFDLVESTRLLGRIGAESYSELLESFHALCTGIVRSHGGRPDDPQGDDGIMSYFGFPVADEDAAVQAVAAALEIVDAVRALNVRVRVGIATGRVGVRSGQPVGVSIHLAARLQSAAAPGVVLVADSTQALVAHRFVTHQLIDSVALKGIEEAVVVYRVDGPAAGERRQDAVRRTVFIGREAETDDLAQQWELVVSGVTRVVMVTGEAGIGKSRLVVEFRNWLKQRGYHALEGRCLPEARNSTFSVLLETLRRLLRLHQADPAEVQMRKIEQGLPRQLALPGTVDLLAQLLSVPGACSGREAGRPEQLREGTMALLLTWLRFAAREAPLCLVVEDLQWIDPSSREFLDRLVAGRHALPMMVLMTERSEAATEPRSIRVDRILPLLGLTPHAARALAREVCGDANLSPGALRLLAARSDGVPLFLEESVRMAADSADRLTKGAESLRSEVPSTLQDLLMARLDRLGSAKAVAQLGATLGREFPTALLQAISTHESVSMSIGELTTQLAALEESGLLIASGEPGDRRHMFKHALVRDVAYQSLWGSDRQRAHQVVAAVIVERFADLALRQPEMLARHQTEAGLHGQAILQWERAAARAFAASAHDEAISHIESGLALLPYLPADSQRDRTELRLQRQLAACCIATEGYGAERVERLYARAQTLCEALHDEAALLRVQLGLQGWYMVRGDLQRARALAEQTVVIAERRADAVPLLQANWALAVTQFHSGEAVAGVRRMDKCLAAYRIPTGRLGAVQDPGVMCLCYSAWAQWELGQVDDALQRTQRVLALARQLDHKFSLGQAHGFAASVHLFRGEFEIAMQHADEAIAICEEGGFALWLAHARLMRGHVLCQRGSVADGLVEMSQGYAMWVRSGAVVTRPMYLALQADGLAMAGRPGEGLALLAEASAVIERSGEYYYQSEVLRLRADLALQCGDADTDADIWLQQALAVAHRQQKRSFTLRAATSLARLRLAQGLAAEAAALLAPALAAITEGEATLDVQSARQMMQRALASASI